MRATVPARGSPPNMPVTTMTGSRTAKMTTTAMTTQVNTFLPVSITTGSHLYRSGDIV